MSDNMSNKSADDTETAVERRSRQEYTAQIRSYVGFVRSDPMGLAGVIILGTITMVAIFAPLLAPYDPTATNYYASFSPPTAEFPLGTDNAGRDVLSQLIYGTRPAIQVGLLSAIAVAAVGTNVGIIAGYFGGYVDDSLMRMVDFAYGVPFLPFAIVLVGLWGASMWTIAAAITLLLWRSTARVIRSHVLTIKEKPYIKSARTAGASDARIIYRHIVPNVLPLTFLYGTFAIAWAILAEAGLSFLGFGDPAAVTWGQMLQSAYQSQAMARDAWWWFTLPGLSIMLAVISAFLIGRGYEELLNPELKEQ